MDCTKHHDHIVHANNIRTVLCKEAVELANKRYDDAKIIRDRKLAELDAL